jgi:hypothetical protein
VASASRNAAPGSDAQLREDPVEVRADGPVGEEQLRTDLFVRQPGRRQLGDLVLLPPLPEGCADH